MLIDFCDWRLRSRISCDRVATDGHETSNLVSADFWTKRKGFLAAHFIRPPVNITVEFACNVDIAYVIVDPVVCSQKSTGFEIFISAEEVTDSWLLTEATDVTQTATSSTSANSSVFVPVGKAYLSEPSVVLFKNARFRSRRPWSSDIDTTSYPVSREFRHHPLCSLDSASHVTVRVLRTIGGSAVSIKSIQIWGQPSISCPQALQDHIFKLVTDRTASVSTGRTTVPVKNSMPRVIEKSVTDSENLTSKLTENGVEIPDDFMDAITCDVMTIPMILPSGKLVDQHTVDKFIQAEASWGRIPSDPFTGVAFHRGNLPVLNVALKARIDQFLLKHSDSLKHLPRTLGCSGNIDSGQDNSIPSTSRILESTSTKRKTNTGNSFNPRLEHLPKKGVCYSASRMSSVISNNCSASTSSSNSCIDGPGIDKCPKRKSTIKDNLPQKFIKTESSEIVVQPQTHQNRLADSLQSALSNTLSYLPSFTNFSKTDSSVSISSSNIGAVSLKSTESFLTQNSQTTQSCCCGCNVETGGALYRLPCVHVICRSCLDKAYSKTTKNYDCPICSTQFVSSEVVRVFNR